MTEQTNPKVDDGLLLATLFSLLFPAYGVCTYHFCRLIFLSGENEVDGGVEMKRKRANKRRRQERERGSFKLAAYHRGLPGVLSPGVVCIGRSVANSFRRRAEQTHLFFSICNLM